MSHQTAKNWVEKMGYTTETQLDTIIQNHTPTDYNEILVYLYLDEQFIVVESMFGDKEITKEEFAKEWVDHANQLTRISYGMDWMERMSAFKLEVEKECNVEFDRLYQEAQDMTKS